MTSGRGNTRILAGLALGALLVLQLVAFLHESAHTAVDLEEPCEICVQLDGSTPLVGDSGPQQVHAAPNSHETGPVSDIAVARRSTDRSARGPPSH